MMSHRSVPTWPLSATPGRSGVTDEGVISGLGRTIHVEGNTLSGLIQTDAEVNPGNSGGPLLDTSGTVVGLVDAKETDASGIAYAIPASTAMTSLNQWRSDPRTPSRPARCQSPTAPDDADVTINDYSDNSEGPDVVSTFSTYANAINSGDYPTAYEELSPAARGRIGFDDFADGNESSFIITFDIDAITYQRKEPRGPCPFHQRSGLVHGARRTDM